MRKLLAAVIMAGGLFTASNVFCEVVDKVEIIVNDEMITRREIDSSLAPIYEKFKTVYSGEELISKLVEARQKIVEQLIDDRLVYSEAKRMNVQVGDSEVDEKVKETIRHFGSKEEFQKALSIQQITEKELRDRYREQVASRRLVDQKVGSKVVITPLEAIEYYDKHAAEFAEPEELNVLNIMVKPGEDVKKSATLIKEIKKRLNEGCDFGGLAKIYSEGPGAEQGGAMGYMKRGDLMPQIEDAIFKLKDQEISGVIQTSAGYHIFKVVDRKPAKIRTLNEARDDVEGAIFRQKVNEKIKAWVATLRKNAYIEIR